MKEKSGLSIVILAAGKGTRMRSTLPKVLHPIGGKSMLARVIQLAHSFNPTQLIVVVGPEHEAIKDAISDPSIQWAEQTNPVGTGDAVARALPLISDDQRVLTLYGDTPLVSHASLERLMSTEDTGFSMMTAFVDNPTGFGRIVRDDKERLVCIREEKDTNDIERKINEINVGIFYIKASLLKTFLPQLANNNTQKEYYLTDIVEMAIKNDIMINTTQPESVTEILGINDKIQWAHLERCYQKQQAESFLKQGVTICDPNRFDVRGSLQIGKDSVVDINALFEGTNTIGESCYIGPHCVLIDCEIGSNVTIKANSYLEGAKIKQGAVIGPFARLRPGTEISEEARVGNFVEIKNTKLGKKSKVNHLSYIGDAVIGTSVNIGAGTITCNYDGVNKHLTIIEDDVHIGSDTQLIAPVTIGRGATVAAGSTLTKDAPSEQLTLTHRLEQRASPWQRPKKDLEK